MRLVALRPDILLRACLKLLNLLLEQQETAGQDCGEVNQAVQLLAEQLLREQSRVMYSMYSCSGYSI